MVAPARDRDEPSGCQVRMLLIMQGFVSLFVENPTPLVFIMAAAGIVLVGLYYQRQQTHLLIAAAIMFAVAALAITLDLAVLTDRESVTHALDDMVLAMLHQDEQRLMSHISPAYNDQGVTRDAVAGFVRKVFAEFIFQGIRLTGLSVTQQGDQMVSQFTAWSTGDYSGRGFAGNVTAWRVKWQHTEGQWKVALIEPLSQRARSYFNYLRPSLRP